MNSYTHKKRPYHATCVQWTGDNFEQVKAMFGDSFGTLEPYCPRSIGVVSKVVFIRFEPGECTVMRPFDWAVKGENGDVKIYSDDIFHVKYEEL